MAERLAWTGYAAAGCAAVRLPLHLYYALGGDAGLSVVDRSGTASPVDPGRLAAGSASLRPMVDALPTWLSPGAAALVWRGAHLATALLLAAVVVLALALVRPWGRRLPSAALIIPAFVVTVASLGYAAGGLVARVRPLLSGALPVGPHDLASLGGLGDGPGEAGLAGWDWLSGEDGLAPLAVGIQPSPPERAVLHYLDWLNQVPSAYPLGGLTALAPWALALGVLLTVAACTRLAGQGAGPVPAVTAGERDAASAEPGPAAGGGPGGPVPGGPSGAAALVRLGGSAASRIWLVAVVLAVLRLAL